MSFFKCSACGIGLMERDGSWEKWDEVTNKGIHKVCWRCSHCKRSVFEMPELEEGIAYK